MRARKRYYVYIMASRSLNLYTGITNNICRRASEHKSGLVDGFTKRYRINRLVYYEVFRDVRNAIDREKRVKGWDRAKRLSLISTMNPTWQDLAAEWGKPVQAKAPAFGCTTVPGCHRDRSERSAVAARNSGGDENQLQIPRSSNLRPVASVGLPRDDKRQKEFRGK